MKQRHQIADLHRQRLLAGGQDHRKLVTAQPVGIPLMGLLQLAGHRLQQPIAHLITEQIVDLLEALEIEYHQRQYAGGLQGTRQLLLQCPTITEPGQGIAQGETPILQIGPDQGIDQHAAGRQQDELPDLQPEQGIADLVDRRLPLLAGENVFAYLFNLAGLLAHLSQQDVKLPPRHCPTIHQGLELFELLEQPGDMPAQSIALPNLGGLAADKEDIEPVPQQIVMKAQGLHLQPASPIEAQIEEKALGLQHYLADVPVDIAVVGIEQLILFVLQIEAAA